MRFGRTIFASVFVIGLMGMDASANDRQLCLEDTLRGDLDPVYTACSRLLDKTFVEPDLQAKYHWRKAEIFYRQHRFKEALDAVELSLVLNPTFPPALMRRAYALAHLGRRNEAFVAAGKLIATAPEWSSSFLTLAHLGVVYLTFGQRLSAFERAIELDPENYLARHGYGSFLLARGRRKEGQAQWQAVLDADREAVDAQYLRTDGPDEFELYGFMLETRGGNYSAHLQYDKALADFTRLIELYPQKARGYFRRADLYLSMDQFELAAADIVKSLELLPGYTKALEVRARMNLLQKKYEQAVQDADVVLAGKTERRAVIQRIRGFALRGLGRSKEAFESLLESAKLKPFSASDLKSRMIMQGYYPENVETSLEDARFINGLMACAIDPQC